MADKHCGYDVVPGKRRIGSSHESGHPLRRRPGRPELGRSRRPLVPVRYTARRSPADTCSAGVAVQARAEDEDPPAGYGMTEPLASVAVRPALVRGQVAAASGGRW
ncbi:hypothetical protein GCM10028783_00900 [Modestobacter muralis]